MSNRYYLSGLGAAPSVNVRSLQVNGQFTAVGLGFTKVQADLDAVTAEVAEARGGMANLNANLSRQRFSHTQSIPSSAWVVNHNMGAMPQVQVLSPGGSPMLAEFVHTSANQVMVYFDQPTTGQVLCFY